MALNSRGALTALSLCTLMAALGSGVANAALPTLAKAFHAPFASVQWIVIAYLLSVTTLIVSAGSVADQLGRRRLLLLGIALFSLASVGCATSPTLPVLIAARGIQGMGGAIMMAISLALVGAVVPRERVGRAMGLMGTMSAVGTALGPSVGGFLTSTVGWRSIFLITVPIGLATFALLLRTLPRDEDATPRQGKGFDLWGTVLLVTGVAAYSLSMTVGRKSFGPVSVLLVVVTLVAIAVFIHVESRAKTPIVPLDLFRDPMLRGGVLASLLVSTVLMATLVVGPFYLSSALRFNAGQVGLLLSVGPITVALWGVPAGRLVDRYGAFGLGLYGLGAIAASCATLAAMPFSAGVVGYLLPIIAIASGYAVFQTSNNALLMGGAASERRGVLSGILNLSRNLGLISGASMMGAVFVAATGAADLSIASPSQVSVGFRTVFALAAALTGAALIVSWSNAAKPSKAVRATLAR